MEAKMITDSELNVFRKNIINSVDRICKDEFLKFKEMQNKSDADIREEFAKFGKSLKAKKSKDK